MRIQNLLLASLLLGAAAATAQTVDFEAAAYVPGKSLVGVDGWARMYKSDSAVPAGNLLIQEDAGNKLARLQTAYSGSVYREFTGAPVAVELRWRWRTSSNFIHMCMGVSRFSSIDGFYPLALACFEPSGVIETKGSQALLMDEKWSTQKWHYMRMVVDGVKGTFSLRMALDSTLSDEVMVLGSSPLNDAAQTLSRVVIRMQNGSGTLDLDKIIWQPLTALSGAPPAVLSGPRDTTVQAGSKADFRVTMSQASGSNYQWTRNGQDIFGANTAQYSIASAARADSGALFACKVSGSWGALTTAPARLTVAPAMNPDPNPVDTSKVTPGVHVLQAANRLDLPGGYSLTTPSGSPEVTVETLGGESLAGLRGFRDLRLAFKLSAKNGAEAFPTVEFACPQGEAPWLYSLESGPAARFVAQAAKTALVKTGTYFLGVDTLAPRIVFLGESFVDADSTRSRFLIEDNVLNPALDLIRSDDERRGFTGKPVASGDTLSVVMKNAGDGFLPLTLRLRASDHRTTTAYPPESGLPRFLAQKYSASRRTPDRFGLGLLAQEPWDLVTFPLSAEPPITLSRLRKENPGADLHAAAWDEKKSEYRRLGEEEAFQAGNSIWMASANAPLTSLVLPSLQTLPQEEGDVKIELRPGWNQIANPTLRTLYWPFTRRSADENPMSPVKPLKAYAPAAGRYSESDSLEPWRGYFVLNNGGDTTIWLRTSPQAAAKQAVAASLPAKAAPKGSAATPLSIGLKLRYTSLRLGASSLAEDGIGVEDEPGPPSPYESGLRLSARRQSRNLETDIVRWQPGMLCAWRIVARLPASRAGDGEARVESLVLPEGYSAWAISRSRGIRLRLDRDAAIPAFAGFADTLEVMAGPTALVEQSMAGIPTTVAAFEASLAASEGGFDMLLRIPAACRLSWTLSTADGRALDGGFRDLPPGIYRLPGARGQKSGVGFLRIAWAAAPGTTEGAGLSGQWSRLILIR